jgi:hydroxypyruvate isomerase
MPLLSVQWEGGHSPDVKSVGYQSMFRWVTRMEIDGSVGCGGLSINTDDKVGGISGY